MVFHIILQIFQHFTDSKFLRGLSFTMHLECTCVHNNFSKLCAEIATDFIGNRNILTEVSLQDVSIFPKMKLFCKESLKRLEN